MKKRVMLLGGNYFQMTATLAAKELGYYVISVDYLPDNPGHKFADEYHNVSTVDKENVLKLASQLKIDGIVSYASDVSAPTAAYVAEKLGLPTNPYESVMIMTHKNLFREFLKKNNFPVPKGEAFTDKEKAKEFFCGLTGTVMVKPVDSAGSKGVTAIDNIDEFEMAWEEALKYSREKQIIVEEFIEKMGYQTDGDCFVVNGKIVFWGGCDQHHDLSCSKYVPAGLSFPSIQENVYQEKAKKQVQKVLSLLGMVMGAYNVEYIVGRNGEIYIIEIGPRNGGNLITDTLKESTGIDLAKYTLKQAVGESCEDLHQVPAKYYCSSYIIHSLKEGNFEKIVIDPKIQKCIKKYLLFVKKGEKVERFHNGGSAIGAMVLRFENIEDMCNIIDNMNDYIQVKVR